MKSIVLILVLVSMSRFCFGEEPKSLSGIYPHLASFNNENECGTGAVVPWANRLWVITYAPHSPNGSSDKLYEITPDLEMIVRPESIGGTPANRMIHRESGQLFIGPYAIDQNRKVRAIPHSRMFGRTTGNARHLTTPSDKILFATMEEGIYEVDVHSLEVKELWGDEAKKGSPRKADLPGYHGKGFYSGQGVYVYANNGEHGGAAQRNPDVASGVLAEWDGKADEWTVIRRNQFTEVTGPNGILGSEQPESDPIWTVGWDSKSLLLGVRMPDTGWSFYRLPKGSHSYDGAHGWNTEWPRIRDIGESDFLMTMHGTFWKFPKTFTPTSSAGIAPRSNYLKVVGDFCRWNDHIVMGCDDAAKAEFLNKRKAKGHVAAPQSQSNLWFVKPEQLDEFGPLIGRGSVWNKEAVKANQASDPYLFSGYQNRGLHLAHSAKQPVTFQLDVDVQGNGTWTKLRDIEVPASGYAFTAFDDFEKGVWVRLKSNQDLKQVSAAFVYHNNDKRAVQADALFDGLAMANKARTSGIIRARGGNKRTLVFAAQNNAGVGLGLYTLDAQLKLTPTNDPALLKHTTEKAAIPHNVLTVDAASVIYTDDNGKNWRLPKGFSDAEPNPQKHYRIAREVATERDMLHADGTFYELPARNAGGIAKLRPLATHNRLVYDFCSYRGLLVMSGVSTDAPSNNPHILKSDDGKVALWAGAIDDVWKLGKPRGIGGPWKNTTVEPAKPSDPYLMTAYDHKELLLSCDKASGSIKVTAQIDLDGTGQWVDYKVFELTAGQKQRYTFPDAFQAYWIRFVSDGQATMTAQLRYK